MFASVFSGKSNSNDRLKQRTAVVDLKITFDGKFDAFFTYLDKIEDHLSRTSVLQNCDIAIPSIEDKNIVDFISIFKNFGILKLQQITNERDKPCTSLPAVIPMDAQGTIPHDKYIAQWQEQSWIYKAVIKMLTNKVKATIAPWHETITLDGIILLFILIQEYALTTNEALILAYDDLQEENIKLSKFGNNVKKMVNHIHGSACLIQACGKHISRQTFIILFEQLTTYQNVDFQ